MKKNLKFLATSAIIILIFSTLQAIHSMDDEQKNPPGIQLNKGADGTLEAVLGTGNDLLLKMSLSLEGLKTPFGTEQPEIPVRLFLTDFTSTPTQHPPVDFKVKVDCASTPPTCIVPDKPPSFDSYAQFMGWLSHGYFISQIRIIYNFHVDIQQSAPSLAQHLFTVQPGGYYFIGAHAIESTKIEADQCVPQVTWSSRRGNTNATTATLRGIFYLNDCPYFMDGHDQVFPHQVIHEIALKKVETKKFSSHKWMTQAETIANVTYAEFPQDQARNWPNAPFKTYSLVRRHLEDIGKNDHIACWDGNNGEEVDIDDGRIFSVVYDAIIRPIAGAQFLDSIVQDNDGNLYTIRYKATTINSLPYVLLKKIFSNLNPRDVKSIALVSRHFNKLTGEILRACPLVALGYEEIYKRFLKGVLIYRPQEGSDVGMVTLPIADLEDPLEGTFDLSECGDAGKYLSIATGYRKEMNPENANKIEIWFAPRFLVERELQETTNDFQSIFSASWPNNSPVGIIWTWGGYRYENSDERGDYLTNQSMDELSNNNLYEKWMCVRTVGHGYMRQRDAFVFFHVHFGSAPRGSQ